MDEAPTKPAARYAKNLKFLVGTDKGAVASVAKGAKVEPKQIYNLLKASHDPRLKSLEKVAQVFGLKAWQMLAVDLTDDQVSYKDVLMLLEWFMAADESGRATILRVAKIAAKTPA